MIPATKARTDKSCAAPAGLARFSVGMPRLASALADGEPVRIIALGSSSTQGAGASSKQACYPARLQAGLRRRFPQASIEVINLGVGGELASDMLPRITADVLPRKPQIVIWQTGVNDALHKVAMDAFEKNVLTGLELMRAAGIDVVLLDQQFFPAEIGEIAEARKVPLLRRYAIMRHLAETPDFEFGTLLAADKFHHSDEGYACLGTLMADAIEASVKGSRSASPGR